MADRYATKDGDWSDVSVWDGGVSLPGAGDTVRPNGFDVVIDQDITVGILTNNASGAAAANGTFTLSDGITVNADIRPDGTSSGLSTLLISTTGDQIINGDFVYTGVNTADGRGVYKNTSGTLTVNGNISGPRANQASAIRFDSNGGNLIVNGDVVGGNQAGGGLGYAIFLENNSGTVTIVGNLTGLSYNPALYHRGTGDANITGDITGSPDSTGGAGLEITRDILAVIVGDVTAATGPGIKCNGTCTLDITGNLTPSGSAPAISLTSTTSTHEVTLLHSGSTAVDSSGQIAVGRFNWLIDPSDAIMHAYRTNNSGVAGDERILYTLNALPVDYAPAEADVRKDTVYNNGESTGSLVVPVAESVAYGVPVDNTTGLALLTADAITGVIGPPSVVQVSPISSRIASRVTSSNMYYFVGEVISWNIAVVDSNGNVNMEEHNGSLELNFARFDETTVATVTTFEIASNVVTFINPADVTAQSWKLKWALRHSTTKEVFAHGVARVEFAA